MSTNTVVRILFVVLSNNDDRVLSLRDAELFNMVKILGTHAAHKKAYIWDFQNLKLLLPSKGFYMWHGIVTNVEVDESSLCPLPQDFVCSVIKLATIEDIREFRYEVG